MGKKGKGEPQEQQCFLNLRRRGGGDSETLFIFKKGCLAVTDLQSRPFLPSRSQK